MSLGVHPLPMTKKGVNFMCGVCQFCGKCYEFDEEPGEIIEDEKEYENIFTDDDFPW